MASNIYMCCEIDYYTTAAKHGVLHRDYTLATGGAICDYWIVPDKTSNRDSANFLCPSIEK